MHNTDHITEKIIRCAIKVSNTLGIGFLEKVYENALVLELKRFVVVLLRRPLLQSINDYCLNRQVRHISLQMPYSSQFQLWVLWITSLCCAWRFTFMSR